MNKCYVLPKGDYCNMTDHHSRIYHSYDAAGDRCDVIGCDCRGSLEQVKSDPGDKFDNGKVRYDLIPPEPINELGRLYTVGAQKYDEWNWAKGIRYSRLYAALNRHLYAWWTGEEIDEEMSVNHLISVLWNTIALYEMAKAHPEMDDRPWRKGRED